MMVCARPAIYLRRYCRSLNSRQDYTKCFGVLPENEGEVMKMKGVAAIAAVGVALSGCATIIKGTTQSISVNTTPVTGANCTLVNSEGTYYLTSPGTTTVHKTKTDLDITCAKDGYAPGHAIGVSHFNGTTAGNILLGGVIGLGVDAASGADNEYDTPIVVPLGMPLGTAAAAPAVTPPPTTKPSS
jgi:hypothetical protein